jgi:hypothetical protein
MRVRLVGVLFVGWLVAGVGAEQARPIFTGMWKFAGDASTPGNRSVLGDEIRITQEANALVLEGQLTQFVPQPDGKSKLIVGGLGPPMVYRMDGEEHSPERNPVRPATGGFTFYYLSGGPYRVSWDGGALVVAGSDEFLYSSFTAGSMGWVRRLLNTRLSMNPDGSLLIERTMERDPTDKGRTEVKKTTLRGVYRKTS